MVLLCGIKTIKVLFDSANIDFEFVRIVSHDNDSIVDDRMA